MKFNAGKPVKISKSPNKRKPFCICPTCHLKIQVWLQTMLLTPGVFVYCKQCDFFYPAK